MLSDILVEDARVDEIVSRPGTRIHFVGVGGAGMSALAKVFLESGYQVSGSDLKESRYTRLLRELGADITIGHAAESVDGQELVVVSSAIPEKNCEVGSARQQGIPVAIRAQLLGALSRRKRTIAVAGSHGKTTTTSMIAGVLRGAGFDPTFVVGGELNDIGSNAASGSSDMAVVEADESDGSLLRLSPETAVVTNIDSDHLDHYKTMDALEKTFSTWLSRLPENGFAVVRGDGSSAYRAAVAGGSAAVSYGFGEENDHQACAVEYFGDGSAFEWRHKGETLGIVRLSIPGRHNVLNAIAAAACCVAWGVPVSEILPSLAGFSGVKRRFQRLGSSGGVTVVDDYAHHPTEIEATLQAARAANASRLLCVFQPHRYSRTRTLARQFGSAFSLADIAVVTDVYAAGEEPLPGVSGKVIADAILQREPNKEVAYIPRSGDVVSLLHEISKPGDLVLVMGAGDIRSVGERFLGVDVDRSPVKTTGV